MGERVRPATFLILDKWLRGDGKQSPGWETLQVLVAELVDGEVADGSHLGRLLALAGLKAALKSDTIDQGCVVLVKALLHGANSADNADSADKDLLLRSQTEAVLQLFQQSDAGEDVEQVLDGMFAELSTDSRVQARREELKMAWEAGKESGAMHKVLERHPFQDLKADLCQLALRVEAKLPPPVLHKLFEEAEKGSVAKHLAAPPGSRSSSEVVAVLISIAAQELQRKGGSIGAPAGGRLVEETQLAAKDKEKRRLDVEILKLRVESMKNLPLSQAEAEVKQRRLQELQATLHLVTSGIQVLKQPL